ncbi:DNA cytosine methyltransferase [Shewanella amazonensis]|uniref:DNA (cytosine-5-)-methyltransferase n=1 Tax=Shewanella amazonensis (strain ATCC BAA-1098 / SB2B) TaxID=326297 RepID=A1S286_SHEAM|nr:DNA cytosine methyltransferase [Shewanella amazonensis]ABL98492.1 modification methylase (cytosine-specific methyltransferase [Shewanella amazonensis SB2B]
MYPESIQVVDLFAGPGGLGEGFSSVDRTFQILVSAEMDPFAHQTLRLRAFYRLISNHAPNELDDYFAFCNGVSDKPYSSETESLWEDAGEEALQIVLGSEDGNARLDSAIKKGLNKDAPWVLIGGPPCQAYSMVGRARNKGKKDYRPEEDNRHFLYKEYLRIIQQNKPTVFVMENVKGILSSTVGGKRVFHEILDDLSNPDAALGVSGSGERYVICSLVTDAQYHHGDDASKFDAGQFVIRAEDYGIPQARHRVILLGIKQSHFETVIARGPLPLLEKAPVVSVRDVIGDLPKLRSTLSRGGEAAKDWDSVIKRYLQGLLSESRGRGDEDLEHEFQNTLNAVRRDLSKGSLRYKWNLSEQKTGTLDWWYGKNAEMLSVVLNHEARGHMDSDLKRYMYAACFAKARGVSPKGHKEFNYAGLAPAHENWESGKFADRFRVQVYDKPSTTVVSHISKDGHYFIHPDPVQCRSLTVREAARLQTFPDNYFFQGNRTQQFHQVGNAVPPLLAYKIARIVKEIIEG